MASQATTLRLVKAPGEWLFKIIITLVVLALLVGAVVIIILVAKGGITSGPAARAYALIQERGQSLWTQAMNLFNPSAVQQRFEQKWYGTTTEEPSKGILITDFNTAAGRRSFYTGEDVIAAMSLEVANYEIGDNFPVKINCSILKGDQVFKSYERDVKLLGGLDIQRVNCVFPAEDIETLFDKENKLEIVLRGQILFDTTTSCNLKVYYVRERTYTSLYNKYQKQWNAEFWKLLPTGFEPQAPTIPYNCSGEPVEFMLAASPDNKQPIIVLEDTEDSPHMRFALRSSWTSGEAMNFKKVAIGLPEGVTLNQEILKGRICPFEYAGIQGGLEIYDIPQDYLDDIGILSTGGEDVIYECQLQIPGEEWWDTGPTSQRYYYADAEYSYKPAEKVLAITINKLEEESSDEISEA